MTLCAAVFLCPTPLASGRNVSMDVQWLAQDAFYDPRALAVSLTLPNTTGNVLWEDVLICTN